MIETVYMRDDSMSDDTVTSYVFYVIYYNYNMSYNLCDKVNNISLITTFYD